MKKFFRVALSLGVLAGLMLERKRPLRRSEIQTSPQWSQPGLCPARRLTVQLVEAPAVRPLAIDR